MKKVYALLLSLLLTASVGFGQLISFETNGQPGGTNNFGASPLAPSATNANITATGLTRGSGIGTAGAGAARGFGGVNVNSASGTAAITANQFFTFTIKANTGYKMTLSSIDPFNYRRSATGATSALLQYSLDGSTFTDITTLSLISNSTSGANAGATTLPAALQNLAATVTVTFRIVPFGGTSATGTFYIFDVGTSAANPDLVVTGTVTVVPLPVTYLDFSAKYANNQIAVSWATATERDNAYFDVERSADAETFTAIGRVTGKGQSDSRQQYSLTDETPLMGWNYYRLRQVDTDGTASVSRPVAVLNEGALAGTSLRLFPNPASGVVTLQVDGNAPVRAVRVSNMNGQWLNLTTTGDALSTSSLPTGQYIIEVQMQDGRALRQRLVKE